jgi:uncharacterized protein YkwD
VAAAPGVRSARLGLIAAGLAALAACAGAPPEPRLVNARSAAAIAAVRLDPAAATAELNAYRAIRGLAPVRLDPALTAMAGRQAKAMAASDTMSHDVAGGFRSRLAASGIEATAAENLGAGYMSLNEAMAGWRGSSGHDANLLLAEAARFGIAIAKNPASPYGVYWAMEMAAEQGPRVPVQGGFMPLSPAAFGAQ